MKFTAQSGDHKFRAIETDSHREAAAIFANRLARREYGKRGEVGAVRMDNWSDTTATYEAFIGAPAASGGITGRNVWIHVATD